MRVSETEVLVVGAGPVGLLTALALAHEGIHATIIDKEARTTTHSYACVLHPATLQVLDRLGLMNEIRPAGHLIDCAAFYDGKSRRAEIKFSELSGAYRYALAVPQNTLEQTLERQLRKMENEVLWNHRLADLEFEQEHVTARIDELAQTAKGYMVADWDWTVRRRSELSAAFVVGADGHDSMARSRLGIDYDLTGGSPERFAIFEFNVGHEPGAEVQIAIDNATTNVLWPLPGQRCRWTFQLVKTPGAGEFPVKDRETWWIEDAEAGDLMKRTVERLARNRAPWFKETVKSIEWASQVRFEHRLAKRFGRHRVWLAGDAVHQTSPVGAQSMNEGLLEAEALASALKKILCGGESRQLLEEYNRDQTKKWECMLDTGGRLRANTSSNLWLREHAKRILCCLPGSREHLTEMMAQLGYEFEPVEAYVTRSV
jgi:2-polyprenyl-6-methoxyphenol hydroxylase-like FAD-dependent oxidoreductase